MSLKKFIRRTSPVALSILIAACGGGSGGNTGQNSEPETGAANGGNEGTDNPSSENTASMVSGRVADGYIQGALVCVDLNENDSCDADEPSATTGVGGAYTLDIPADAQNKPIVADIPAEAIDEDTGKAVGQALVFIAPGDKPEFLSPITTLVHQELRANPALNTDDAEQAVKSILGIDAEDVSLFTDYVAEGEDTSGNGEKAEKFRYLHDTARVVASMMKDIETQVETAAESNGFDAGDAETQRAIREIVRSEVRDLLPQIAQQVAEIVRTEDNDDTSGESSAEASTEFDPDQLALNLRPADAGENVRDRIDAVQDRVEVVRSDIKQLLTDGVYWMEFDCNYDIEHEGPIPVEGEIADSEFDNDVSTGDRTEGNVDYPTPKCEARYGHVQLGDSGDTLDSDNYLYDSENATPGWIEDMDEGDLGINDYSLVDGQWVPVDSDGPVGNVEFTEDGSAVITNEAGQMQLKAVTQEIGSTPVINHFWEDAANPLWFDLVKPTDLFSSGSLAHKISIRQSSHPYTLFNHYPHDDQAREHCAQFNDNCNVVNAILDGQHNAVISLDEIRNSASLGINLLSNSAGINHDTFMKLSAELPADGTLPSKGLVKWSRAYDGHYNGAGEIPPASYEPGPDGVDPYGIYPTGNNDLAECHEKTDPDGNFYPDEQQYGLPVDGGVPDSINTEGSDGATVVDSGQDAAEQFPEGPDSPNTGIQEFPEFHKNPDCVDLIAQTGSGPDPVDYPDQDPADLVSHPDQEPLEPGNYPQPTGEDFQVLISEWKLIEVQGVTMIEIQIPFALRHEVDNNNGAAMLLIEHEGFVRMGARLPESFIDRVITYNETAFTTLRSIVETGINDRQ